MKRLLGKLLILMGISVIFVTVYINVSVNKSNNNVINEYKNNITNKSSDKNVDNVDKFKDVVGVINIPKIDVEVAIKEGTDEETLKYAVGHYKGTAMPGDKGNCVIAGHRNYTHNKFFSNLDKVELGDEIEILTEDESYTYKVNDIQVVTPETVEVLEDIDKDKKHITLITCTPKYVGSHRLIVVGEQI